MVYIAINPREVTAFEEVGKLVKLEQRQISAKRVKELLVGGYTSCCNINHVYLLELVRRRFGIRVDVSFSPMRYSLRRGDRVIMIVFANLRRLTEEEKYTEDEVRKGSIFFTLRTIPRGF
jgi:hypothetical protein